MRRKAENNVELVTEMMEFSNSGALAQMFIIDAIQKLSRAVATTPIEDLRKQFGENPFVSADAWQRVAREIDQKMTAFYSRHEVKPIPEPKRPRPRRDPDHDDTPSLEDRGQHLGSYGS